MKLLRDDRFENEWGFAFNSALTIIRRSIKPNAWGVLSESSRNPIFNNIGSNIYFRINSGIPSLPPLSPQTKSYIKNQIKESL